MTTVTYEKHRIDVASHDAVTVATVYDADWFFAANDLPALKTLLDRADGRLKDAATTLAADENYTAAFKHMPASYAAFAYGRLDRYFARLAKALPKDGSTSEQFSLLQQIRSIAGATGFENGKIRDVLFVGMPQGEGRERAEPFVARADHTESFLYFASFLHLPNQMPDAQKAAANGFPAAMQGLLTAFTAKGITLEYLEECFCVGAWPHRRLAGEGAAARALRDVAGERRRKSERDHGNNRRDHRRRQRLDDIGERGRAIFFSATGEPDGPACPDDRSLESAVRRGTRRGVSGGHDQTRRVEQRRLGHVANFQRRGKPCPCAEVFVCLL